MGNAMCRMTRSFQQIDKHSSQLNPHFVVKSCEIHMCHPVPMTSSIPNVASPEAAGASSPRSTRQRQGEAIPFRDETFGRTVHQSFLTWLHPSGCASRFFGRKTCNRSLQSGGQSSYKWRIIPLTIDIYIYIYITNN